MKKTIVIVSIALGMVGIGLKPVTAYAYASPNPYVQYIITKESDGVTTATNPTGCYGIMQACPGAPLRALCGGDGDCQLSYFDRYCRSRYGSWFSAYLFRKSHNWW